MDLDDSVDMGHLQFQPITAVSMTDAVRSGVEALMTYKQPAYVEQPSQLEQVLRLPNDASQGSLKNTVLRGKRQVPSLTNLGLVSHLSKSPSARLHATGLNTAGYTTNTGSMSLLEGVSSTAK